MSPIIAASVINFTTSREVWVALEKHYGSTSKARINQLRGVLQNTKKGTMKMTDFLGVMKQASDSLQLAGKPVQLDDLFSYVLAGLDFEYMPIVCTIEGKDIDSWQEFSSLLVTYEGTLSRMTPSQTENSSFSANLAYNRQGSYNRGRGNNTNNNSGINRSQGSQNYNGQNNGQSGRGNSSRGRGRAKGGRSGRHCYLCNRDGHTVPYCYLRFDDTFNNPYANNTTNESSSNGGGASSSTYIATPEVVNDPKWIADSGATNHITADLGQGFKESDDARNA